MEAEAKGEEPGLVNPRTGLASDYVNHLAEVSMLVDLLGTMPELVEEVLVWRPLSYEAHFRRSKLRLAPEALRAHAQLRPEVKRTLDNLVSRFDAAVLTLHEELRSAQSDDAVAETAGRAAPGLAVLLAEFTGLVSGTLIEAARSRSDAA
jgi:hypothetical protein